MWMPDVTPGKPAKDAELFDAEGCVVAPGFVDTPMTAHPKRCPETGELHFYGYQFAPGTIGPWSVAMVKTSP